MADLNNPTVLADHMLDPANNHQYVSQEALKLAQRAHRLVTLFLNAAHAPNTADWLRLAPDGDVEGYIMATYVIWSTITGVGTMNLGTLMGKDLRAIYREISLRFPVFNWDTVSPKEGLRVLRTTSYSYKNITEKVVKSLISPTADTVRANPMFPQDLERLIAACPPTIKGYRFAAFMIALTKSGARATSWLLSTPTDCHHRANGCWVLYYTPLKLRGVAMDRRLIQLTHGESRIFNLFYDNKDLVEWENNNNLFCLTSVEAIDKQIYTLTENAGYPKTFFSSHSGCVGLLNTILAKAVLEGTDESIALANARLHGEWKPNSDAVRGYIRETLDNLREFAGQGEAIFPNLNIHQLHPELLEFDQYQNNQMPVMVRNEIVTGGQNNSAEIWRTLLDEFWDTVRGNDPQDAVFLAFKSDSELAKMIGTKLLGQHAQFQVHQTMHDAVQSLRDGGTTLVNARAIVVKVMLQLGYLKFHNIQQAVVPEDVLNYFALPKFGAPVPDKPTKVVNAMQSTNLLLLKRHLQGRSTTRARYVVVINGITTNILDVPDDVLAAL